MNQKRESSSLGKKEGSRRATCVYIAVSGTSSPPCHALYVLFGSGHPPSGTTQVAICFSQNIPGSLPRQQLRSFRKSLKFSKLGEV